MPPGRDAGRLDPLYNAQLGQPAGSHTAAPVVVSSLFLPKYRGVQSMIIEKGSRIAVIGAGISGIAAASVLKKNGFVPIVFEKHERIGGVWATAYPGVHLQNIYPQYRLSDLDWSFKPDLHPTGEQIMRYLSEAVEHLQLDIRLKHEILAMKEQA